jgi:aspartyl-tRNA(Asn)/glutamyl-tRNA(Gln) amidotransferase subunit B
LQELGLDRIKPEELRTAINRVVAENPDAVRDYEGGKEEALHFLAGKVMKLTHGRADARKIIELLRTKIMEEK